MRCELQPPHHENVPTFGGLDYCVRHWYVRWIYENRSISDTLKKVAFQCNFITTLVLLVVTASPNLD